MAALAAAGGAFLWLAARAAQSSLAPVLAGAPDWLRLAANAAAEEALRLGLAVLVALGLRRIGARPRWALLGVLASCVFAAIEHAGYLAAFPTADVYWRAGYSGPIHANAAALYAVFLAPLSRGAANGARAAAARAGALGAAFLAGWAWHALFNLSAALWNFPALPALGTALNLSAMAALLWAAERTFVIGGPVHGRPRNPA